MGLQMVKEDGGGSHRVVTVGEDCGGSSEGCGRPQRAVEVF